jgi:short-subunit dehydrogenase
MTEGRPTALVTGASSGLGLEMAKLLAARGYDLLLTARNGEALTRLAREIEAEHGVLAATAAADLAAPGGVDRVLEPLRNRDLGVDLLVNNAGFGLTGALASMPEDEIAGMLQVNIVALTRLTRAVLPGMLQRGRGRILNVASTAGFFPGPNMAVYYATKAYVISFSEAIAEEVSGSGVTVTALCPGPTRTGFAERARMNQTNLLKVATLMSASDVARAGVDGAHRGERLVIPGLLNRMLVESSRVAPRRMVAKITGRLNASSRAS